MKKLMPELGFHFLAKVQDGKVTKERRIGWHIFFGVVLYTYIYRRYLWTL
jgi:hypothetical protein